MHTITGRRLQRIIRVSSLVSSGRTRGNGHHHEGKRFPLNIKKHFLTVKVTEHCNRLLREVVACTSLEIFRSHLKIVLGNDVRVTLLEQGAWLRQPPEVIFPSQPFCDLLWFMILWKRHNKTCLKFRILNQSQFFSVTTINYWQNHSLKVSFYFS